MSPTSHFEHGGFASLQLAALALLTARALRRLRAETRALALLACGAGAMVLLAQQTALVYTAVVCCCCCCCCLALLRRSPLASDFVNILHKFLWAGSLCRRLPLNWASRVWGRFHQLPLPHFARAPTYRLYSRVCQCNLDEADFEDLRDFRNLSEFFRRDLKPHMRPVCRHSCLVSPADGRVLHLGRVVSGHLEQVKGITYTLQGFLGPRPLARCRQLGKSSTSPDLTAPGECRVQDSVYHEQLKMYKDTELYHCVIYLSPGDYHKFHSCADWSVSRRRHFPGFLLSVSPRVANLVRGLFCLNERAVYMGRWRYGFFSYAAVGATNVGSISVFKDETLVTNRPSQLSGFEERDFDDLTLSRGELFGEFNLGSTVVLLFEAPRNFRFSVGPGERILMGGGLGCL